MKASDDARTLVKRKLDRANQMHADGMAEIQEAASRAGFLAHKLNWICAGMMQNDIYRRDLSRLLALIEDSDSKVSIADVADDYRRRIMQFRPVHSTSAMSRIQDEVSHLVDQEMLELIDDLKEFQ